MAIACLRFVGSLVVGGQYLHTLLLDEWQSRVNTASGDTAIDRQIGRRVNVRRAIVAVDAIHAAFAGLVDLRRASGDCPWSRIR